MTWNTPLPLRHTRSRAKGARLPDGVVCVTRGTRYGNPFPVQKGNVWAAVHQYARALNAGLLPYTVKEMRAELAGRDLACWCKPGAPCHADVLIRQANQHVCAVCERPTHYADRTCRNRDCTAGRKHIEADRLRRERTISVRRPPEPPHRGQRGVCALCGAAVQGRRRTWCSDACVELWNLAILRHTQMRHLSAFFHGCWSCGLTAWRPEGGYRTMYVDHVKPLWSLTPDERTQLRWWLPFNLQLLCKACHDTKTKIEAGQRAYLRRRAQPAWTQPDEPVRQDALFA